jgi:hypothetical protein
MAARLSALRAGRTLPSGFFIFKDSWYSFLLEAESTPGPVRPEELGQFKKSTSSGLEPVTFRLAAWCLNHYATAQLAAPYLRRLVVGFPPRRLGFKPGSGHVRLCDGQKCRWGRFSPRSSVSPANLHSICLSTIIFSITRGWHNRPGVAAVPIAS